MVVTGFEVVKHLADETLFINEKTDAVDAIKFLMDQRGLSVKNLEPMIGKSNRVYEVLSRKRPLTLAMIRRLHKSLGIPADVLIA